MNTISRETLSQVEGGILLFYFGCVVLLLCPDHPHYPRA